MNVFHYYLPPATSLAKRPFLSSHYSVTNTHTHTYTHRKKERERESHFASLTGLVVMKNEYLTWRESERDRDYRITYTVDHVADNRPITFDITTYICVAV